MGGMSLGVKLVLKDAEIIGIDNDKNACISFRKNVDRCIRSDVSVGLEYLPWKSVDLLLAGPPCRPFSVLNQQKREKAHKDYSLSLEVIPYVEVLNPSYIVIENVPPFSKTEVFTILLRKLRAMGYLTSYSLVNYAQYGAPISRTRLFILASRDGMLHFPLPSDRVVTVRGAIWRYRELEYGEYPDHEWLHSSPDVLERVKELARRNKFGFRILEWDKPAPSFGNIAKTYIIHPDGHRVISIREAMALMGFPDSYIFPRMGKKPRYQMVADAVSPIFIRELIMSNLY